MTPIPGSLVSARSSFCAASSVPSATHTMPAWIERPMPTPPPVMQRDPARARRRVDQRVEQRPVGDRVGAVDHALRLPVGRRHRPRVEVVAPDHDRRADLAGRDHRVEAQPQPVALAVAEPADSRREPLERDVLAGRRDPSARAPRRRGTHRARRGRSQRCRPDRPTARPSGTAPCPRQNSGRM